MDVTNPKRVKKKGQLASKNGTAGENSGARRHMLVRVYDSPACAAEVDSFPGLRTLRYAVARGRERGGSTFMGDSCFALSTQKVFI